MILCMREGDEVFTVKKGKRYLATSKLSVLQGWVGNETVAGKFREVGFTEVEATGAGRNRLGKGLWPHPDTSAEVPPKIVAVKEIEV